MKIIIACALIFLALIPWHRSNLAQPPVYGQGAPFRLLIPKINVDAKVESVGLTAQGAMDTPAAPADVAWFNRSARPGEEGSAVIAGHLDWKDGAPAVFAKLSNLQKGDKIFVQDEKGITVSFTVKETRTYNFDASPPEVFASASGSHLNLITCQGAWNKANQSYSKRLVVFADLTK